MSVLPKTGRHAHRLADAMPLRDNGTPGEGESSRGRVNFRGRRYVRPTAWGVKMSTNEVDDVPARFICSHCGAFAHHVRRPLRVRAYTAPVQGRRSYDYPNFADDAFEVAGTDIRTDFRPEPQWVMSLCSSCSRASVWRDGGLIFPSVHVDVPRAHADMPDAARTLYDEAAAVLPLSRRASAALARAAMEALLKELAPENGRPNLQNRLGVLQDRINPALWRVLTALRVVGNDALHGDEDDLVVMYLTGDVAETVEPFFGAINALVEELVTQPKRAEDLYNLIPESKRLAAERASKPRVQG